MDIFPEVSINLPLYDSCGILSSGDGCRADDFKTDSSFSSLDREDRQDFVIRCRTYSNPNSSDLDREGFVSTDTRYIHIDSRSVMELLME